MDYAVGERVEVRKYGSWYPAVVTATGRTTVTVAFVTNGGREKAYTVPGHAVATELRHPFTFTRRTV